MTLAFPRLFRRKQSFSRAFERHSCAIDTMMTIIDRMIDFEGRLIDISRGGAMFRPKLAYIMSRNSTPVMIRVDNEELYGHIVNTTPAGFAIRWDEPLDDDIFDEIVRHHVVAEEKAA